MQALFLLLKRYQAGILFVILEGICIFLVFSQNKYHSALFFNSANSSVANVLNVGNNIWAYFSLKSENQKLAEENKYLRHKLSQKTQKGDYIITDSIIIKKYEFWVAKVVNNSTYRKRNYITINKGRADGIEKDMGLIASPYGVVGKIVGVSEHFSTAISLLHSDMLVSAQIKKNRQLGTIKWLGGNPSIVKFEDVPSNVDISKGDTIITSGYNTTFLAEIPIGIVKRIGVKSEEKFHDIDVELITDFNSLHYVYVVKNILKLEQEKLERESWIEIDE